MVNSTMHLCISSFEHAYANLFSSKCTLHAETCYTYELEELDYVLIKIPCDYAHAICMLFSITAENNIVAIEGEINEISHSIKLYKTTS